MSKQNARVLTLLSFLLLLPCACAPKAQTASVKIIVDIEKTEDHAEYPGEFWPQDIVVKKGTTVTWTNTDAKEHTVTSSGVFSQTLTPKGVFSYTFREAGNFTYQCDFFHEMTGVVTVE